jgi:hypothetical protein
MSSSGGSRTSLQATNDEAEVTTVKTPPMNMRCSIYKIEFHLKMTVAGNSTPNEYVL